MPTQLLTVNVGVAA